MYCLATHIEKFPWGRNPHAPGCSAIRFLSFSVLISVKVQTLYQTSISVRRPVSHTGWPADWPNKKQSACLWLGKIVNQLRNQWANDCHGCCVVDSLTLLAVDPFELQWHVRAWTEMRLSENLLTTCYFKWENARTRWVIFQPCHQH